MKLINPEECPPQNPSFSQASVTSGATVYVSGQIGIEPTTGKLAADDIAGQTTQIFRNLECILKEAGSNLDKVVKTTIFIVDLQEWAAMNDVYGEFFGGHAPPKSTVEVSRLALGARVEIEFVAET